MTITADTLLELIADARDNRVRIEAALERLASQMADLTRQRTDALGEEEMYRLTLDRRFPAAASPSPTPPLSGIASVSNDLLGMSRIEAVETAVRVLTMGDGYASPQQIESYLQAQGREDSRDNIGAALAYLNRKNRVKNIGRGQWVLRSG